MISSVLGTRRILFTRTQSDYGSPYIHILWQGTDVPPILAFIYRMTGAEIRGSAMTITLLDIDVEV